MRDIKVIDICKAMEELAPLSFACEWDNPGLLIGKNTAKIGEGVVIALDLSFDALETAIKKNFRMIITHHPVIFHPIINLSEGTPENALISECIRTGTAVYSSHTNLDAAIGGVNEALCEKLNIVPYKTLIPICGNAADKKSEKCKNVCAPGFIRMAKPLKSALYSEIFDEWKKLLPASSAFVSGEDDYEVKNIAVTGGAFDDEWTELIKNAGADTLITGELKHHQLLALELRNVRGIAFGHKETENPVLEKIKSYLENRFIGLEAVCSY